MDAANSPTPKARIVTIGNTAINRETAFLIT